MEVFRIGTEVDLGKNLKGTVLEVLITESNKVQYKCVWWDGNKRTTDWLSSLEVEAAEEDKMFIGFRRQ
jgi:hypothetical protein